MSAKDLSSRVIREFRLTTLALKNKNTVFLLTLLLVVFGIYSYRTLPKELFPEITWPQIMVQTVYFGNSPEDIENLITRPLEQEIDGVRGLKELTSISAQDASMIFAEFNTDVDLEDALRRVKDAVDNAESELPAGNEIVGPTVFDLDFTEFPILNINLSGNYSVEELRKYAEDLQDRLEAIGEVSAVYIEGINEREIKVNVDLVKMEAYDLTFYDITSAIEAENVSISGGEILLGKTRRTIRVAGEFEQVKDLENIIVKRENGKVAYLRDVAGVTDGFREPTSFARLNHEPVVSVQIVKKSGENLLSTTKNIYKVLDESKEEHLLPPDLNITITNDQSEMVEMQLANLENSMLIGMILVIIVLFFFLGTRNALFVGLAIPMSILISFVVIGIIDFRINMIVLFSLILALGMLVDNAIVVVENIYRFVDKGYKPMDAAHQAVGEIAGPIIASTLTTLAAFSPLVMWKGIMGEFMKFLPVTLIIVLTSSLFVALVIIPVVSASFIKERKNGNGKSKRQRKTAIIIAASMTTAGLLLLIPGWRVVPNLIILFGILGILNQVVFYKMEAWFQDIFLVRLENLYHRTLTFALKGRNLLFFFIGTLALLVLTVGIFFSSMPDVVLFPENDPNYINIVAELAVGNDITGTDEFIKQMEEDIFKFLEPDTSIVESVLSTVGKGDPMDFTPGEQPNKALITISFIDFELRGDRNTSRIMRELSDFMLKKYPGVELEFSKDDMGPPTGKAINIEIIGRGFAELVRLSDTIQTFIEISDIKGIEGLKMNISPRKPELLVNIDRDKAQRAGLSTQQIAFALRTALFGSDVSDFKVGEDDYPIQVRLMDRYRYNLAALKNLKVTVYGDDGPIHIPISAVANFEYTTTFSSVRRKDMNRVITLYSNVIEGYNANSINQQLVTLMEDFEMPAGYTYAFTGEQQEQEESSDFLMSALLIAVALILLILVTQFNSVIRPLIIIVSVIFSTIGVFGGLATFNMDFIIIMTGIGIITLAGIVVNNAIVLIDYIELLKARRRKEIGLPEDAYLSINNATDCIIKGGKTRLRPVLLTAITTILGLLPMAVGLNIDFAGLLSNYEPNIYFGGDMASLWSPMSWTVIFGLTFATFLTLVIVPVMYRMTTIAQKKWSSLIGNINDKRINFVNGNK